MRKKNIIIILLSIIMLLIAIYGLKTWKIYNQKEVINTEKVSLINIKQEDLNRIEIKKEDTTVFIKTEDRWVEENKEHLAYDQEVLEGLIEGFLEIEAFQTISNIQDYNTYGINESVEMITLYSKDGTVQSFYIGKEVPDIKASYMTIGEGEEVYMVSDGGLGLLNRDSRGFIEKKLILPDLEQLNRLTVIEEGQVTFDTIYKQRIDQPNHKAWLLTEPYESVLTVQDDIVKNFKQRLKLITKEYYVAELTDETKTQYGFDKPSLEIIINDEKLVFGQSQGSYIYFYTTYEPFIYKTTLEKVKSFKDLEAFDLIEKEIYVPNVKDVAAIELSNADKQLSLEWKNNKQYLNGQVIAEETANELFNKITSLKVHSAIVNPGIEQNDTRQAEIIIQYRLKNGGIKTFEFIPFDPSFYILRNGKLVEFAVNKKEIMSIWNIIKEAQNMP